MNWFKENKFLTGFLAVVLVGAIVLIFLLLGARSKFSEVSETYDAQARDLETLQHSQPYPDQGNLKKVEEQRGEYKQAVNELQQTLRQIELPLEPMTPEQFQNALRKSVTDVQTKAQGNGSKLPDGFYLGFGLYQTQLPSKEAAPALGRELKAVEYVADALLENRASLESEIKRQPLPGETGAPKPSPANNNKGGKGAAKTESPKAVEANPFSIEFTIDPIRLRRFMNEIASTPKQFFIVRNLEIKNEKEKSPPRAGAPGALPEEIPVPAAAGGTAAAGKREYILGGEKVSAKLLIEMVVFPETPAK